MDFDEAVKAGLIETMGEETDRKFMANVTAMINDKETVAKVADTFKLVYTSLPRLRLQAGAGGIAEAGHPAPDL